MSGRAPRRKGDRVERLVLAELKAAGLEAKRVPLSGSAIGYPGDLSVTFGARKRCVEVKARADFRTLHSWLEGRDALILKADRRNPLLVVRLADVLELLKVS